MWGLSRGFMVVDGTSPPLRESARRRGQQERQVSLNACDKVLMNVLSLVCSGITGSKWIKMLIAYLLLTDLNPIPIQVQANLVCPIQFEVSVAHPFRSTCVFRRVGRQQKLPYKVLSYSPCCVDGFGSRYASRLG